MLDSQEQSIHQTHESNTVERLCKVIMMMKSRSISFQNLHPLKWDLGLPDDLVKTIVPKYPDLFRVGKTVNGGNCLSLVDWKDEFAVSALQKMQESKSGNDRNLYREFKRRELVFPMSFPRGYGGQKKVRAWMEEFHKLPYISPYEDWSMIDPLSDLMEKRVVGVLHELLSLTIHKKTKRNYLRCLREELCLPHKFTRIFTRYPGIFYLSLKCKTTTVALKEGYQKGKLVDPHPLSRIREKYYYVMRTGVLYRGRGVNLIPDKDGVVNDGGDGIEEEGISEEEVETDGEYSEEYNSEMEDGSDED